MGHAAPRRARLVFTCRLRRRMMLRVSIDIRGFTGLETPNELHYRGALTDAHAHVALIILIVMKRDHYSLLSRQLK